MSSFLLGYRARKSRRTLKYKVRINVVPYSKPDLLMCLLHLKNALFNSFLLYRPNNFSETHALLHFSNEKYCYMLLIIQITII